MSTTAGRDRVTGRRGLWAGTALVAGLVITLTASATSTPATPNGSVSTDETASAAAALCGPGAPGSASDYRFLSAPDFLNADIADLRKTPRWRPGKPNSISPAWQRSLDTVLDTWDAEQPGDVLVAGDLVNGHWACDDRNTGLFGPIRTEAEKRAAVSAAARPYYRQWVQRFASRGLPVHVAVGDHDIGDNPWKGKAEPDFKRRNLACSSASSPPTPCAAAATRCAHPAPRTAPPTPPTSNATCSWSPSTSSSAPAPTSSPAWTPSSSPGSTGSWPGRSARPTGSSSRATPPSPARSARTAPAG